ncbi:hypothetical protein [Arthrobacter sp. Z4-13]
MSTRSKKIMVMVFAWIVGVGAGAGISALFQNPADKGYWSSVALLAAVLLAMMVATWVRNDRPTMRHGLWAIALALIIPAIILALSFGTGPALGAVAGGLTVALIITWPYLTDKGTASNIGS